MPSSRSTTLIVLAVLTAAAALTWVGAHVHEAWLRSNAEQVRTAELASAAEWIQQDFARTQDRLRDEARRFASDSTLVGLVSSGSSEEARRGLIERVSDMRLPEQVSIEVYDEAPMLLAWSGPSMPLDEAPSTLDFLRGPQTVVVQDGRDRVVLALWWPLQHGEEVVGAVRVMRLLHYQPPVQNRYLHDFGLVRTWRRSLDLSVEFVFASDEYLSADRLTGRYAVPLVGFDGRRLGEALLKVPDDERLVSRVWSLYENMLAVWLLIALAWVLYLTYAWHRRRMSAGEVDIASAGLLLAALWGVRFTFLAVDIPARWQTDLAPLSPLFDPSHFASAVGFGLLRSTGDLLLTALFALGSAVVLWNLARRSRPAEKEPSLLRSLGAGTVAGLLATGTYRLLSVVAERVLLDSTLDLFSRTDLMPVRLVLVLFSALLILTAAAYVVTLAAMLGARRSGSGGALFLGTLAVSALCAGALFADLHFLVGLAIFLGTLVYGYRHASRERAPSAQLLLSLRGGLIGLFFVTASLYPVLYRGLDIQRHQRLEYAVETFVDGRDPRVRFAVEQLLQEVAELPPMRAHVDADSLAAELLRGSLLSAVSFYDVRIRFVDTTDQVVGEAEIGSPTIDRPGGGLRSAQERLGGRTVAVVEASTSQATGWLEYAGVARLPAAGPKGVRWAQVVARPPDQLRAGAASFPRVLLPSTLYASIYDELSLAAFENGMLVRSFGSDFGRYRLSTYLREALDSQRELWREDVVGDRSFLTFYRSAEGEPPRVIAARVPAVTPFDHLFYLLRLLVAGLVLGVPLFLGVLLVRWYRGDFPGEFIRFQDKVLNAFLGIGLLAVFAVGLLGARIVLEETNRAVQEWLRGNLERVEETLALDSRPGEMPYEVLERTRIDSLSAQVGLDLNVFQGRQLVASSRPQLVRERLIDRRLPVTAFQQIFHEGYRFAFAREEVGSLEYMTGFRALVDEGGQPRYVIALPTLPEQQRIEDEGARMIAYLFGAILLLIVAMVATASTIASALARPIARLRRGLQSVAQGQFEEHIPVTTRDEVGDLVRTFNDMQGQLSESRRKLAHQERQLAWREMARQVAHEIKNPLTPMKLSVQHLQRAYQRLRSSGAQSEEQEKFDALFDRITRTLIEQVDALARIANEFHAFARMPARTMEKVDLTEIVAEAVSLMQEEQDVEIRLRGETRQVLSIEADRQELRRAYINLLKNAIQAVPPERTAQVEVYLRREVTPAAGDQAFVSVTDNGTGIAREVRPRIFEPNFSTKTSGTGLGLAITAKAIRDLGGEIGFDTEEDEGTTFWTRLPLLATDRR